MINRKKYRPKIIILFAGTHLAYSPTVTQLYDDLSGFADVTILAEMAPQFISQKLTGRDVIYYTEHQWPPKEYTAEELLINEKLKQEDPQVKLLEAAGLKLETDHQHFNRVKTIINAGKYDRIIALDMQNLFFCTVLNRHADFLSLELGIGEEYLPFINYELVDCVITQSEARYEYIFKNRQLKTFIIPNSPVYEEYEYNGPKQGLLYGGTAWEPFGFFKCLDYLKKYKDASLTVQGAVPSAAKEKMDAEYADLLKEQLLIINSGYLNNEDVVPYFAQFEIGICFYNFEVEWIRHFNYQSAPSGKIFKYLAAGLPVLAVDIIGFKFIEEMNCGVLISDLSVESIRSGIEKIRSNYDLYASNTKKAAAHFSFDKAAQPYVDFVKATTKKRFSLSRKIRNLLKKTD